MKAIFISFIVFIMMSGTIMAQKITAYERYKLHSLILETLNFELSSSPINHNSLLVSTQKHHVNNLITDNKIFNLSYITVYNPSTNSYNYFRSNSITVFDKNSTRKRFNNYSNTDSLNPYGSTDIGTAIIMGVLGAFGVAN